MIKMIKKYERTIAILLIAFLALPLNLFTSLATVFAEEGGETTYLYEADFTGDEHKLVTDNGTGNISTIEVDGEEVPAYEVKDREKNYFGTDLAFEAVGMENGKTYNVAVDAI